MPLVFWIHCICRVAHPLPLFSVPMSLPKNVSILLFAYAYIQLSVFFLFHARFSGTLFTLVISRQLHLSYSNDDDGNKLTTHRIQQFSTHTHSLARASHTYPVFTDKVFNSMRIYQVEMDMCAIEKMKAAKGKKGKKSNPKRISTIRASLPLLLRAPDHSRTYKAVSRCCHMSFPPKNFIHIHWLAVLNQHIRSERMDDFYLKFCLRSFVIEGSNAFSLCRCEYKIMVEIRFHLQFVSGDIRLDCECLVLSFHAWLTMPSKIK